MLAGTNQLQGGRNPGNENTFLTRQESGPLRTLSFVSEVTVPAFSVRIVYSHLWNTVSHQKIKTVL
jgi:hypothetical protein